MRKFNVTVNGETFAVEVEDAGSVASAPRAAAPAAGPAAAPIAAPAPAPAPAPKAAAAAGDITSPLPGTILKVNVSAGQSVKAGDVLMILEAMKMENEIMAPADGTVTAVHVAQGATVQSGDPLVSM